MQTGRLGELCSAGAGVHVKQALHCVTEHGPLSDETFIFRPPALLKVLVADGSRPYRQRPNHAQ